MRPHILVLLALTACTTANLPRPLEDRDREALVLLQQVDGQDYQTRALRAPDGYVIEVFRLGGDRSLLKERQAMAIAAARTVQRLCPATPGPADARQLRGGPFASIVRTEGEFAFACRP